MERTPRLSDSPLPETPRPASQRTAFQANPSVLPSRSVGGSPMGQTGGSTGDGPAPSSAASRILALKRKRQRQQIITVSIILVAATGFLSYAALQFAANQKRLAKQDTPQNVAPAELQREFEDGMKANAARESDLAPVPSDLPTLPMDERKDPPEEMGDSEGVASLPSPFDIKPIELPPELVNAKESSEPPRAAMPMENVSPPPGPTPSAPDATAIDTNTTGAAGKEKWNAAMKAGREALAKTDFQAFAKAMESAIQLPMTSEMEAKQKRLDQVGQLYQIAVDAMREARTKTRGTEEITVGKNLVNIVEVTEDAIIVRVAGKNERYNWNQLPLGLALAMSDLTLSDREPTDLAARAVYLSLAPNKTGLYDKKIREFFDKSLGKGEIRTDLPQAFTDSYE